MVFRDGAVKRVAALAAVQFDVLPSLFQRLLIRRVPALEVPAAELALLALHITGPLARLFFFQLDLGRVHVDRSPILNGLELFSHRLILYRATLCRFPL